MPGAPKYVRQPKRQKTFRPAGPPAAASKSNVAYRWQARSPSACSGTTLGNGATCRDPAGNVWCEAHEQVRDNKRVAEEEAASRKPAHDAGVRPDCELLWATRDPRPDHQNAGRRARGSNYGPAAATNARVSDIMSSE